MDAITTPTILIVEDEESNRTSLEKIFQREGYRTLVAENGRAALDQCRKHRVHVLLTDLMLPGMSGIDIIKALKTVSPDTEFVVMTAYGTVETAVEAMREGAYDFVEKPLKRMQIVKTVRKAAERRALLAENRSLRQELSALRNREIVGSSPVLRQSLEIATQAAPSTANVLILGESGTGKELLARHIHRHSSREGDFVGVNLAALPETIVESELFGHEKGAFTGAVGKREGRIAQAAGDAVFGRNRRACSQRTGQVAARATGGRVRAFGREDATCGFSFNRRDQSRPRVGCRSRTLPRRPLLQAQRHRD